MSLEKTKKEANTREQREEIHFKYLAENYHYDWWGYQTPAAKVRFERRIAILQQFLNFKGGDKVLECGCGAGDFTSYLSKFVIEKNISLYGIELSEAQLKNARLKVQDSSIHLIKGSITKMPFEDNYFDFVIGNSILHHLDMELAGKEIRRVLKPGGRILFFEPNIMNPIVWLSFNIDYFRKLHQASPDEKAFWRWELEKKLISLNYKDVIVRPFDFMYPLIPKSFFLLAKKLETLLEKTFLNEIAGSLIVYAQR